MTRLGLFLSRSYTVDLGTSSAFDASCADWYVPSNTPLTATLICDSRAASSSYVKCPIGDGKGGGHGMLI